MRVSEFRIESGLNCGGHAFASDGFMLGPILEEFKAKRDELSEAMFATYKPFILQKLGIDFTQAPAIDITVQGGIGRMKKINYYLIIIKWQEPVGELHFYSFPKQLQLMKHLKPP